MVAAHSRGMIGSQKLKTMKVFQLIGYRQKVPLLYLLSTASVNKFPSALKVQVLSVLIAKAYTQRQSKVTMKGHALTAPKQRTLHLAPNISLVYMLILYDIIYLVPPSLLYLFTMNRQYESIFRTKKLNHHQLKSKILSQYPNINSNQKYNYDEFLYILDQQIHERCDRDVLHQLYTQACNNRSQASLDDLAGKYIENLETSKVCILRDQYQLKQLQQQYQNSRNRSKSFIFFKLIQASIYTRFTKEPTFQYKIQTTDLPLVTLVNSLNPVLNHQYTLEMEENEFDIVFYQSGIEILRWTFPDKIGLEEGEYTRIVQSENVTFQAKIKYMPKDQNKAKANIKNQMNEVQQHLQEEKLAFHRLCVFKPFLERGNVAVKAQQANKGAWYNFTESLFDLFPFLRQHVKTLFYLLIATILFECWTSFYWAIEFLDIITCFYALSFLLDPTVQDFSLKIMILQLTFLLLCIKSIWGAVEMPFFTNSSSNKVLIVVCIILKIIVIFCLSVSLIRKEEIHHLKSQLLTEAKQVPAVQNSRLQDNIWED